MCKQEIHFFNPNDVLKKRKLSELSCPAIPWRGGQGQGLPPRGAWWARWHCGRQFGESRCEADILPPCHLVPTRQLSWEAKRKQRQPSLSACWSIKSLGHSQHTGRWHRVTSANLWISRIVSFLLCFPLLFVFVLRSYPSLCSGKGCPTHTHTFLASQGRCDTGLEPAGPMLKEVICWHLHFPKGLHTLWICLSQIQGTCVEGGQCLLFKSWPLLFCTGKQFPPGLVYGDWKPGDLFKIKPPQSRSVLMLLVLQQLILVRNINFLTSRIKRTMTDLPGKIKKWSFV